MRESQQRVDDGDEPDQRGERLYDAHASGDDALVDDRLEDQRNRRAERGIDDDQDEEAGEHPPVRARKPDDPAQGARPQFLVGDRAVTLEGPRTDGRPALDESHQ